MQKLDLPCEYPIWSPGGDLVACSSYSDPIQIFDGRDGTLLGAIPGTAGRWYAEDWSSDGRSLTITASISGSEEIFIAEFTERRAWLLSQLTSNPEEPDVCSSWSPSQRNILYRSLTISDAVTDSSSFSKDDLVIVTEVGQEIFRFDLGTIDGFTRGALPCVIASWSSDGTQLGVSGWHLIDIRTGTVTDLLPEQDGELCTVHPPVWSPDGKVLLIQAHNCSDANSGYDIFTIRVDGSDFRKLTDGSVSISPSWSPDGRLISYAYHPYEDSSSELYIMNSDGSDPRVLLENGINGSFVQWLPPDR
jgi:Tol biopolymer transport system component